MFSLFKKQKLVVGLPRFTANLPPPPSLVRRDIKTPTEIAFEKAAEYDAIHGYVRENYLDQNPCGHINQCSPKLMARYNLEWGSVAAAVIGHLEQKFNSPKK